MIKLAVQNGEIGIVPPTFITTPNFPVQDYLSGWCVVAHYDYNQDGKVVWLESCRFAEAFNARRANENSEWRRLFVTEKHFISIQVIYLTSDQTDAARVCSRAVREYQPVCNFKGGKMYSHRIKCIETGFEFESSAAACRIFGIQSSNMSLHLNGSPNHKTVRGLTFMRI